MRRKQEMLRQAAILGACALSLAGILSDDARAQPAWRPDKAVELITSSAAGGSNDKVARTLQKIAQEDKLTTVPINVVNKPGGNQTLSRAYLNQHPGDAHYFEIGNPTLIANHVMGVSAQHHKDFTPIALLINEYTTFVVKADSPIKTLRDLLERLKKDPESVAIGVSNLGGTNHVTLSLAAKSAGVDLKRLRIVVFKSNSEGMTAVLGGHLQMIAASVPPVIAHVQAGTARVLAVGAPQRMSGVLAEAPTLREHGINTTGSNWRAIIGPKGLSAAQIAYWEDLFAKAVKTEEWKKALEAGHWEGNFLGSREFGKYLDNEYNESRAILTDLGLAR